MKIYVQEFTVATKHHRISIVFEHDKLVNTDLHMLAHYIQKGAKYT